MANIMSTTITNACVIRRLSEEEKNP